MVETVGSAIGTGTCEARLALETMYTTLIRTLEPEIAALRPLFDGKVKGFLECANKCIKIDYKHVLGMELEFTRKGLPDIGGFHHDLAYWMEKNSPIKFVNKIVYENGCYKADLIINGVKIPNKTFFPAHWSREKVIAKIFEAYNNFIKNGRTPELTRDGKYVLKGFTNEGIEIAIFITKKGIIKTAYPKF